MAEDRKARLAALAARAGRRNVNEVEGKTVRTENQVNRSEEIEKKEIKFRNYAPKDGSLDKEAMQEPPTKRPKKNDVKEGNRSVPQEDKSELEKALAEAKVDAAMAAVKEASAGGQSASLNITSAPKKVNWDLKRDIAKKMNRLERRTQKAIVELLRERLEKEAEEDAGDLD